ncbi:MAG TPA: gamma-glutamyltransferase family protein [Xanthobacteraceae bacterium]|nr:gamma-glutamyltransferase family protein [Xanthobacteraceae bacterium]
MIRDFHFPGRSSVLACEGMAATSHPLATHAAIETLRAGGTAADAAVTAVALLGVVEPAMTGIGGDCFCIVAKPSAPPWGYNGSGRAGAAVRTETLLARGPTGIALDSIHAVTVPGAVEAWASILAAHGRFGLDRALQPAIRYARDGFPIAPRVGSDWALAVPKLRADAGAARHYLNDGHAPAIGEVMRFPALAKTLEAIAVGGPRAFYEGPIARDIVATIVARGGLIEEDDLARHRGDAVAPVSSNYRGLDLVELPPNGQGIVAQVMLNILERFDLARLDPLGPERFHLELEAARLAYAVRDAEIADPAAMRKSVSALLDKGFARELAGRIDLSRRVEGPALATTISDTVYLTVVDRDRMAVSFINSLYSAFGVGVATANSGIMLHNRGACFVVAPGHPNTIGPDKRPMHTIIPALAMREGRCEMSFGVMGGHYQAVGHAHVIGNMTDHGMDVQAAIDAPRAFFEGDMTLVERGVPDATVAGLKSRGHNVAVRPLPLGGGQAIQIDWDRGVLIGGSDPRKDGLALGY